MLTSLILSDQFNSYQAAGNGPLESLGPLARVNIFVGQNNCGKSRFIRLLSREIDYGISLVGVDTNELVKQLNSLLSKFEDALKSYDLIEADYVNLPLLENLKKMPSHLNMSIDNFSSLRHHFTSWSTLTSISRIASNSSNNERGREAFGSDTLAPMLRGLSTRGLKILEQLPTRSKDMAPNRVYIPILRGLRPLDKEHTDFYRDRTIIDYFPSRNISPEWVTPEIFTGLKFYEKLHDLITGDDEDQYQLKEYQQYISRELFEGQEVTLTPNKRNNIVTVKIGKEAGQPIYNLGDGVQAAILLSFLPFTATKSTFFFIEEPELHMHPGLQRKIMELYNRKQEHIFFLTTHSNHLLDLTIDLKNLSIFTFQKQIQINSSDNRQQATFKVTSVSSDHRSSLELLGVRNSSVFLANTTIWVEGITDRWYLRALLRCYLRFLRPNRDFAEDIHYSFVEYGGHNITHWSFLDMEDHPIEVDRLCGRAMVIVDQDGDHKLARKEALQKNLKDRLQILNAREIENLLPPEIIREVIASYEKVDADTLPLFKFEDYQHEYLGKFIQTELTKNGHAPKRKGGYAGESGTIKDKVTFCERASEKLALYDFEQLPKPAQQVAEKIYSFIQQHHST